MTTYTSRGFAPARHSSTLEDGEFSSVMTKIKFIGTIQPNEKVNVKQMCIQEDTLFTSFFRTIYQESHDSTIRFFENTYEDVFALLFRTVEQIKTNINKNTSSLLSLCKTIVKDIQRSFVGIKNVQVTYKENRMVKCRLETLTQLVENRLEQIKELCPDIVQENIESENDKMKQEMNEKQNPFSNDSKDEPEPITNKERKKIFNSQ